MKTQNYTADFAKRFKKSYTYKMGGTQTIVFPNGQIFNFDDREYYSGRGSKYNASIKHDAVGDVLVSKKELNFALKMERDYAKKCIEVEKLKKLRDKKIADAAKKGVYSVVIYDHGSFIELSDEERYGHYFDLKRLANTLKISEKDASLLTSQGKTYVFAKSEDGNVYELYHSSLSCNNLSISFNIATPERVNEFIPVEWQSAPFADIVGQTNNNNHFVC